MIIALINNIGKLRSHRRRSKQSYRQKTLEKQWDMRILLLNLPQWTLMFDKQRTIRREITMSGIGLHTGNQCNMTSSLQMKTRA